MPADFKIVEFEPLIRTKYGNQDIVCSGKIQNQGNESAYLASGIIIPDFDPNTVFGSLSGDELDISNTIRFVYELLPEAYKNFNLGLGTHTIVFVSGYLVNDTTMTVTDSRQFDLGILSSFEIPLWVPVAAATIGGALIATQIMKSNKRTKSKKSKRR